MAYVDYSAFFSYKQLLTYQALNQLGANDQALIAALENYRYNARIVNVSDT